MQLTQPVGQHINSNVRYDLTLKSPPNIPVNSFLRNEKGLCFTKLHFHMGRVRNDLGLCTFRLLIEVLLLLQLW